MIMSAKRLMDYAQHVRHTDGWRSPDIPVDEQHLFGATVGIVGASDVGRVVLRLLRPFDAKVLLYDPYLSAEEARALAVEQVSLDDLFARADIVSLHAPSIPETRHMVGAAQLRRMRDGALLVNTARGSLIDQEALVHEAGSGRIRVALDVTTPEPLPGDSPLRAMPNVIITPHLAGQGPLRTPPHRRGGRAGTGGLLRRQTGDRRRRPRPLGAPGVSRHSHSVTWKTMKIDTRASRAGRHFRTSPRKSRVGYHLRTRRWGALRGGSGCWRVFAGRRARATR